MNQMKKLSQGRYQYLVALLISLVFCYFTFSTEFVTGSASFFTKGDARQHLSGWLFFQFDDWHYPLLFTERFNTPEGLSIAFTDSIPLLAIMLKAFGGFIPDKFNYFGYYVLLCFVLQALASIYLIRALGCRTIFSSIVVTVFALSWPALLNRLGHTSLMSHFLLIYNLGFYFRYSVENDKKYLVHSAVLVVVSFLIHPYLFVLNLAIFFSSLCQGNMLNNIKQRLYIILPLLVTVAAVVITFGYLGGGKSDGGYDFFSMNLASPICGGVLTPCIFDGTGGQYEGFSYFGLGLLILMFGLLFKPSFRALNTIYLFRKYGVLIIVFLLLTVYALSNKIILFSQAIIMYDVPFGLDYLTNTFRASGRFFWPVGYLILFLVLSSYLQRQSFYSVILLSFVTVIQIIDVSNIYNSMRTKILLKSHEEVYQWDKVLDVDSEIYLYPRYGCGLFDDDYYLGFQYVAANNNSRINTGYISRASTNCNKNDYDFSLNGLYILSKKLFERMPFYSLPQVYVDLMMNGKCLEDSKYIYCYPNDIRKFQNISSLESLKIYKYYLSYSREYTSLDFRSQVEGTSVETEGFVLFGPYLSLPKGKYLIDFSIEVIHKEESTLGYFDIVGKRIEARDNVSFSNRSLLKGDNAYQVDLDLKYDIEDFEFRVFKSKGTIVKFKGLKIQRILNENS